MDAERERTLSHGASGLTPGTRLGPYEIRQHIGRGGMGEVYRAHDSRLGRDVAIKISAERFGERVEREARAIAALNHPNICTLHDVGPNYLVMELLNGPTLADRIRQGPIPLEEALTIARQIAAALEAAHEQGIIHRDLKPGNIAVRDDGAVKVLDFGLAKVLGPVAGTLTADSPTFTSDGTQPGVILGTAAYMSPEQARGKPVDKRTDIWAFGVVLYEMLTGARPFKSEDVSGTLAAILTATPDLTRVPTRVRPLIERCLEKDPRKRLRDITGANLMLELGVRTERPQRRFASWAAGAAVTVGVSLAAIGGWTYLSRADDPVPLASRFKVTPTEAMTEMGPLLVSPDGRWMVFYATDLKGVTGWWLRPTDSTEMRLLSGTETANRTPPPVIWSPDSRSIAFSTPEFNSAGQLKRLDIDTGKIRKITDIPRPIPGGSWSRGGVLLLGGLVGGVTRVQADGGARTAVTRIDASRREEWHLAPQFLSDERHFLYQRVGAPENTGIYVGDIDAQPDEQSLKPLLISDRNAVYVPPSDKTPSRLVFQRGTALFVQEFDEQRLELRGDPIPIADGVGSFAPARAGHFSVSPHVLAFQLDASSIPGRLTWLDESITPSTVGDVAIYGDDARLSPDGRRIAVSRTDDTGNVDVWVVDTVTGTPSRVTDHRSAERIPVWSFDGKNIFYTSNRSGNDELYQRASDASGGEQRLVSSPARTFASSASPDGDFLIYTSELAGLSDIWALPLDPIGKAIPLLNTDTQEVAGRLSPDGRWLVYVSDVSGAGDIYVRRFLTDGGRPRVSDTATLIARGPNPLPFWRDNTQILFMGRNPLRQMVVDVDGRTEMFQRKGAPRSLFEFPPAMLPASAFSTSSLTTAATDGSRFLYVIRQPVNQGPTSIVMVNWQSTLPR